MPTDELPPPQPDETPEDPQSYAIRRVREVVAETQLIHHAPPNEVAEPAQKAKIEWQLHVWSVPRKGQARPLGMADMGGPQQARPRDAAKAKR